MALTWKNESHLEYWVTGEKNGSHLEKWVTFVEICSNNKNVPTFGQATKKLGQTWKNLSHLEYWVTLEKLITVGILGNRGKDDDM